MNENTYGMNGSGQPDLADGVEGAPGAADDLRDSTRMGRSSLHKRQMVRANVFLVVLFIGAAAVVYGLSLRKGPDEAKASTEQQMVEAQVDSAILRISHSTGEKAATPNPGRITRELLQNFYDQIAERQVALEKLRKNPFIFVPPAPAVSLDTAKSEKSKPPPRRSPAEDSYEKAMVALKRLHLQSVMMGHHGGTAIICNNLLTVGQEIEGFKIASISSKSVVLVWRDKKFVLEMP